MAEWHIEGDYMETCNCDFLCPCITSNLTAVPTEGDCKAAIAMKITKGEKDGVSLDGLSFIVLLHAPGAMADGNIKVGLIVDEKASDEQTAAIGDIATGAAGGPMEALGPLVGEGEQVADLAERRLGGGLVTLQPALRECPLDAAGGVAVGDQEHPTSTPGAVVADDATGGLSPSGRERVFHDPRPYATVPPPPRMCEHGDEVSTDRTWRGAGRGRRGAGTARAGGRRRPGQAPRPNPLYARVSARGPWQPRAATVCL